MAVVSYLFFTIFMFTGWFLREAEFKSTSCRCVASDSCWPDSSSWDKFNSTIGGRLIKVSPPAAPCHDPHFDEQACSVAQEEWYNPFWRSDQPGAYQETNWEMKGDEQCLIGSNRRTPCLQGSVPVYAVNVMHAADVQAAVTFATERNLRLVIKNTGHDYLGRSTAPGSFSIWLHNLQNMTFHDKFVPNGCMKDVGSSAVTVGAGVQFEQLYQAVYEQKSVIVGGGCSSVGAAGGYSQGGGHSPISPAFGLAADNILEYEVVTADGKLRIANTCQNQELFWALRGGGGGTFGVVVSATHRLHPALESLFATSYNFTANDRDSFEKLLTEFVKITPRLSDVGWSGYFLLSSRELIVLYLLPNKNRSVAQESMAPLLTYAEQQPGIQLRNKTLLEYSSFEEWRCPPNQPRCLLDVSRPDSIGFPIALTSRLIPRDMFIRSPVHLARVLNVLAEDRQVPSIIGALVAGGAVAKPQDNAVNDAWRRALWLVLMGTGVPENSTAAVREAEWKRLSQSTKLLVDLTPGSGAYLNEADFYEETWEESLFGKNYPRLLAIKKKVDPKGLFTCHHCVGSEESRCKVK